MKFLCAVYFEPAVLDALSREEATKLVNDSIAHDESLRRRGVLIAAGPLTSPNTATTVRSRGGKVVMTDGPFAESKEVLGGFLCIDVASRDEALRIAAAMPMAGYGSIEVRELRRVEDCGLEIR